MFSWSSRSAATTRLRWSRHRWRRLGRLPAGGRLPGRHLGLRGCPGEQQGPGLIRLRGLHRDPLLVPAQIDLPGTTPASLESWWLGWAEDGTAVFIRLAEVSGSVVGGLAGFGKTMLVAHLLGQFAPSPAVQFVLVDGKGGPDYDRLVPAPGWRPKMTWSRCGTCCGKHTG